MSYSISFFFFFQNSVVIVYLLPGLDCIVQLRAFLSHTLLLMRVTVTVQ